MLNKISWLIVLIFILYILIIFKAPNIGDSIGTSLGMPNFGTGVRSFKKTLDGIVTRIPSKEEVTNSYDKAYSGVVELKDNFEKGVDVTKQKIDTVRKTLSGANDTYQEAKETFNNTKELIENTSKNLGEMKKTVDKISETTKGFGSGSKTVQ